MTDLLRVSQSARFYMDLENFKRLQPELYYWYLEILSLEQE